MIRDASGANQQITVALSDYQEAQAAGLSLEQLYNQKYPTGEGQPSAFHQVLASEGIILNSNAKFGLRSSSIGDMIDGRTNLSAGVITKEAVPTSRILYPAALMSAVEDKLTVDLETSPQAFESMLALDDSINHDRWERPVLNFSKPEAARSQAISQLALPASMLTITASDVTRKIPTRALGLEISDQALQASSLDLVGLALARQAATERNERANEYILSLLQGDADFKIDALSSIGGKVIKANALDASVSANGQLSHRAWIKWLNANANKRRITHVITDLDGAMAIENRTGKPVITGDNPNSPRIDAIPTIINPSWDFNTKIFITRDPNWPTNTIMGIDTRYGIHRVKSLWAQYEAVEQVVMRRATQMRFDHGEIVYRLFDEAFEVLSLTI
jgi:hypothetical protein